MDIKTEGIMFRPGIGTVKSQTRAGNKMRAYWMHEGEAKQWRDLILAELAEDGIEAEASIRLTRHYDRAREEIFLAYPAHKACDRIPPTRTFCVEIVPVEESFTPTDFAMIPVTKVERLDRIGT